MPQWRRRSPRRARRTPRNLSRVVGHAESLLYRRGNFNGTFDDLICAALLKERDAEIALSPGFRWGTSVLPGQAITMEDIHNATAITYPQVYRMTMTGERLKEVLEDVADNLFNPDPVLSAGRRHGALRRARLCDRCRQSRSGQRISGMTLAEDRQADRVRRRTTPWPAGPASMKAPKVRRSGTWSSACRTREDGAGAAKYHCENFRGLTADPLHS